MQESGICRALIQGQERDIGDTREPFEGAPDLSSSIDPERPWSDLIDDDGDRGRRGEATQLRMVADESADAQGICGGDRHDQVGLGQGCGRRGMATRSGEIVGDLVVGIERCGDIDDRLLDPLSTGAECGPQTG